MLETCSDATVNEHEEDIVNNGVVETRSVLVDGHEEDIDDDSEDDVDTDNIDDMFK